jgi:O-succinylbenzoic acid--CoA ligase
MVLWLERRAELTPERSALVAAGRRLSWQELAARVRATAARLRSRGVKDGDVVAALLGNEACFVELFHATPGCGAVWLPLNARWTVAELVPPLRESGARWLLHGEGRLAELAQKASRALPELRCLRGAELASHPGIPRGLEAGLRERIDLRDKLAIVYTSGTSGRAKGVELTHANFFWGAVGSAMHTGASPDDAWLACLPLFHVAGLSILARAVLFGATVVLEPSFDADRISRSLDEQGISLTSLVPTMLERLLDTRGTKPPPPRLRCVLLGGGPIPRSLLERAWELGWPVAPTYGLTETAAQVATLPLGEIGRGAGGAKPLFPTEVAVVDSQGRAQPAGVAGEIEVRGPTVMAGYRGQPAATAAAFRDGWLRTGDVGFLDEEGFLHVLERRSDLIVTGGENVAPAEVEETLMLHPAVEEAAVAPQPDPELGQRVAAWVVLRPHGRATTEEIQRFCRGRLAGYKVPRSVRFVASLPRSPSGKLLRRALSGDSVSTPPAPPRAAGPARP